MKKFKLATVMTAIFMFVCMAFAAASPKDELGASLKAMENIKNAKGEIIATAKVMGDTYVATIKFNTNILPTVFADGSMELRELDAKAVQKVVKNYDFYLDEGKKDYVIYYGEKGKNDWSKVTTKKEAKRQNLRLNTRHRRNVRSCGLRCKDQRQTRRSAEFRSLGTVCQDHVAYKIRHNHPSRKQRNRVLLRPYSHGKRDRRRSIKERNHRTYDQGYDKRDVKRCGSHSKL